MSLLADLTTIITNLSIPVETGVFSGTAPETYAVLTPLAETFDLFADNRPLQDIEEVRISLFTKGNYKPIKKQLETALFDAEITITERRYIGHEDDTMYHHIAVDTAKNINLEE